MKHNCAWFFLFGLLLATTFSCSKATSNGLFSKKTQREKYEEKVREDSGKNNPVVNAWLNAGGYSLNHPLGVTAMYAEAGKFTAADRGATALVTDVKRGQLLTVSFRRADTAHFKAYMDLWHAGEGATNKAPEFIIAADTLTNLIWYVAEKDEKILVRFQQEIGAEGGYRFTFHTGPSLMFPIAPSVKSNIGSLWNDPRDGGARKHEGVDIFAPKHSPAVAVADGEVTSVSESPLGGKYVFMQPNRTDYNVYYAHLDSQLVHAGQRVVAGQVLGLTGNTGNAKFTASHLHFGIYTYGGAIDPLLFIKPVKAAENKTAAVPLKNTFITTKPTKLLNDLSGAVFLNMEKGIQVKLLAVADLYYRVELPDGRRGFVLKNLLK